jgi:hypothetical protein
LDKLVRRAPALVKIWDYQILYHQIHHETPDVAFNFNPPFLGDLFAGLMPRSFQALQATSAPSASFVSPAHKTTDLSSHREAAGSGTKVGSGAWSRPIFRYGSAALLGLLVVGAAFVTYGRSPGKLNLPSSDSNS